MLANLKAWREQRGELVTLPCGLDVRLVQFSVLDLAMDGDIPTPLTGLVDDLISGKDVDVEVGDFSKMAPLLNLIAKRAIIDPPVSDEPDDDHLGVGELTAVDKFFIFERVNDVAGVTRMGNFRQEEKQSLDAPQPGDGVLDETVGDTGDS